MMGSRPIPSQGGPPGAVAVPSVVPWFPPTSSRASSEWARIDLAPPHRPPRWWRVALATVLSVALSLIADAALVAVGTRLFPATKGYVHFAFDDYAKLTVLGVLIAGRGVARSWRAAARPRAGSSSGSPSW